MSKTETHVAILLPTKGRAEQAAKRVEEMTAQKYPKGVKVTVVAAVIGDDDETLKALKGADVELVERKPGTTAVDGWNLAYKRAKEMGAGWVVLGADDVEFKRGWLSKALDAAAGGAEVVGLNDGHTNMPHYGAHFMASVPFLERYVGGFISPPMYSSWWFDREVAEKANSLGKYAYTPQVVIEHHHPDWGLAEMDATYEEAWPSHDVDRATYYRRRAQGYPVDYVTEAKMEKGYEDKMVTAAVAKVQTAGQNKVPDVDATEAAVTLANQHGIDLTKVKGSGADGRVLVSDVQAAVDEAAEE